LKRLFIATAMLGIFLALPFSFLKSVSIFATGAIVVGLLRQCYDLHVASRPPSAAPYRTVWRLAIAWRVALSAALVSVYVLPLVVRHFGLRFPDNERFLSVAWTSGPPLLYLGYVVAIGSRRMCWTAPSNSWTRFSISSITACLGCIHLAFMVAVESQATLVVYVSLQGIEIAFPVHQSRDLTVADWSQFFWISLGAALSGPLSIAFLCGYLRSHAQPPIIRLVLLISLAGCVVAMLAFVVWVQCYAKAMLSPTLVEGQPWEPASTYLYAGLLCGIVATAAAYRVEMGCCGKVAEGEDGWRGRATYWHEGPFVAALLLIPIAAEWMSAWRHGLLEFMLSHGLVFPRLVFQLALSIQAVINIVDWLRGCGKEASIAAVGSVPRLLALAALLWLILVLSAWAWSWFGFALWLPASPLV
jgi:hypothetical protein